MNYFFSAIVHNTNESIKVVSVFVSFIFAEGGFTRVEQIKNENRSMHVNYISLFICTL